MSTLKIEHISHLDNGTPDLSIDSSGHLNIVNGNLQMGGVTMLDASNGDLSTGNNASVNIRDAAGEVSGRIRNWSSPTNSIAIESDPSNSAAGSYLTFTVDGAQKMTILGNNVGIGTTSPSAPLTIGSGATSRGSYSDLLIAPGGDNAQIEMWGANTSFAISHFDNDRLGIYSNVSGSWSESRGINIKADGNVGIGTSSPNSKLEVATSDNVNNYSDGAIQVVSSSPLAFVAPSNLNPSLNRWGVTLREGGEGHFGIRDYRQASTRFTIDESGNVGIGTTLPQAKLHINSNDGMIIPVGTEAQRQSTPSAGTIRFNSSSASFEGYNGSTWVTLSGDFVNTKSVKFALGSYVDLAGGPNLGTGAWTASLWIKPTQNNLGYQEFFSAPGSNIISNGQYLLGPNSTFVDAWSAYTRSTYPLTLNEWYNIVWVRPTSGSSGAGSLLCYINGELNDSGNVSASGIQTYANLRLGSDDGDENSSVYMDEVALWDTALSASAIKDIYNDGSPSNLMSTVGNYSSASDLIGYWRFSEGTGTTVADLSGNSYDGTLNGSVSWSDQTPETNWSQITDIFNDGSCKAHYLLDNHGYDKSVNDNYATSFVTGSGTYSTSIKAFGTHSFSTSNSTMDLPDVVTSYPFTVSAWVYKSNWTATGTQNHLVMNTAIGSQRISLCHVDWNNNGGYEWSIMYGGSNHWTFAPGSMNNGQWYHVVFAVNSSNNSSHAVYLNGTALSATNRGGAHGGNAGWALGGNFDGSENFDGQISNVRVFNRQLSATEAMSLYSKENLNIYP